MFQRLSELRLRALRALRAAPRRLDAVGDHDLRRRASPTTSWTSSARIGDVFTEMLQFITDAPPLPVTALPARVRRLRHRPQRRHRRRVWSAYPGPDGDRHPARRGRRHDHRPRRRAGQRRCAATAVELRLRAPLRRWRSATRAARGPSWASWSTATPTTALDVTSSAEWAAGQRPASCLNVGDHLAGAEGARRRSRRARRLPAGVPAGAGRAGPARPAAVPTTWGSATWATAPPSDWDIGGPDTPDGAPHALAVRARLRRGWSEVTVGCVARSPITP